MGLFHASEVVTCRVMAIEKQKNVDKLSRKIWTEGNGEKLGSKASSKAPPPTRYCHSIGP